eukprot:403377465
MFQVYDKDAGAYVDVREIMDLDSEDFQDNKEVTQALDYMNLNNPIKSPSFDIIPTSMSNTMTFSNSKLNSYLQKSSLESNQNENRNTAILYNRMTQFDTLHLPSYLLSQIKEERKLLKKLDGEEKHKKLAEIAALQNTSWQDWWEIKMNRNINLINAVKYQKLNEVKDLLNEKLYSDMTADINFQKIQNQTPLHYAVETKNLEIVKFLIKKYAELNARNNDCRTPLHLASANGSLEIVQELAKQKTEILIDAKDENGNTPLHLAAQNNQSDVLQFLVSECRSNISAMNNKKLRPIDLVQDIKITQFLQEYEQKILAKNQQKVKGEPKGFFQKTRNAVGSILNRTKQEQTQVIENDEQGHARQSPSDDSLAEPYNLNKFEKQIITIQDLKTHIDHKEDESVVSLKSFNVIERLGKGSFGSVYLVEKVTSTKIYAMKVLEKEKVLKQNLVRDLKPDNVVFDDEGHALLTDFGLSKEGLGGSQQSQSFCGSVAYLAPEMLKRQGHTKSIDWYLLGVLLYEMLVGVPPYFSTDRQKLFENIQGGPLKIPHTMSENARGLILQLLNRNPLKRLGAGPKDSDEIKTHIFFKDVDWKQVIDRQLPVPKPRIRKIEPNPISIQSFLHEEQKLEERHQELMQQQHDSEFSQQERERGSNKLKNFWSKKPTGLQRPETADPNKIPGWSYIKKQQ